MTRTLVVLCALAVGACDDSAPTGQDLAACQVEAIKVYPHWRNNLGVAGDMGDFTYLCMKAKGYEYADLCSSAKTGVSDSWINETSERCYRKAKAN
jgi:hypothetical protein